MENKRLLFDLILVVVFCFVIYYVVSNIKLTGTITEEFLQEYPSGKVDNGKY